jgi:hypothetical protein
VDAAQRSDVRVQELTIGQLGGAGASPRALGLRRGSHRAGNGRKRGGVGVQRECPTKCHAQADVMGVQEDDVCVLRSARWGCCARLCGLSVRRHGRGQLGRVS